MDKIRVLQFPVANSKGGITQYALQNWKFIDKSRFQFDFATMSKSLDFADELEKEGCKIHYISCYAEDDRERFIDEFTRVLSEGNYDIVHLHTKQWKSFLVEQIAKKVGVRKIIVHAHSTNIEILDKKKRENEIQLHSQILEQLTENIATDFWTCSWKAAEFIFGDKIPRQEIKLMNNAIELSRYAYNPQIRKAYRKKLGITDEEYVIGNVGRFVYSKNQEFLLKIFAKICGNGVIEKNKYKLLLVGSGEREQEYKNIVCGNGLEDRVIFTGYRTDVSELLQVMDIFCLPSRFEGLPISLIEAQAAGLYCIVSQNVTEEVQITKTIIRLPLNAYEWIQQILTYQLPNEKDRYEAQKKVKEAGYDIWQQIKIIEKSYIKMGVENNE